MVQPCASLRFRWCQPVLCTFGLPDYRNSLRHAKRQPLFQEFLCQTRSTDLPDLLPGSFDLPCTDTVSAFSSPVGTPLLCVLCWQLLCRFELEPVRPDLEKSPFTVDQLIALLVALCGGTVLFDMACGCPV